MLRVFEIPFSPIEWVRVSCLARVHSDRISRITQRTKSKAEFKVYADIT